MEVRIGIKDSPRELAFETASTASEVRTLVGEAISSGAALVSLTDVKGHEFLIAAGSISFVELGGETSRKVGFIS